MPFSVKDDKAVNVGVQAYRVAWSDTGTATMTDDNGSLL
jgi:hypothetical protein